MNRKKIVIPILIIFILVVNMLVSTVYRGFMSFAVDNDGIEASVDTSDVNNIKLTLGGNVEGNIISIKYTNVYMSIDKALDYFGDQSNSYTDITNKNQGASNSVLAVTLENVEEGKTYTIAIDIDKGNGQIETKIKQKDIVILNNSTMKISFEQNKENTSNLIINVVSNVNDIVLLKIAKSSEISKDEDFKTRGEVISITPAKDVTVTYGLKEEGAYKIYAEDSKGHSNIINTDYIHFTLTNTIVVPVEPDPIPDPIPDLTPDITPDDSQGNLVVPMPDDNNEDISGDENGNENNVESINIDNNDINDESQNNSESNSSINSQTNIKSDEQINNGNNESLPKTGVEDTGIILLIVILAGVAIISFIKFIRIK